VPDPDEAVAAAAVRPATRRRTELLLVAAVAGAIAAAGWHRRWTSDDAFITFRVVEHLLAGDGPVFNAGERVEVATSPLWLFILTGADAVVPGDAVAWGSIVLGLLCTVVGVALAMLGARALFTGADAWLTVPVGALVLLALPPTWDFATSGLETGLSTGWVGASFWGLVRAARASRPNAPRPLWLFVLLGLGPLVRPDLALIAAVLLAWLIAAVGGPWWRRALGLVAAGVLPVGYQLFRMGYYGLLVPNTAVAKEAGRALWGRGLAYLDDLVTPHLLWVPGLVLAGLLGLALERVALRRRESSLVLVVLLAAALHAAYVVRVGGDFMHARLLMPSLVLALCPVMALPILRGRLVVVCGGLMLVAGWAVVSAAVLRTGYEGHIGPTGIADERGFYAAAAGDDTPVVLADHGRKGISAYSRQVAALDAGGRDLVVAQVRRATPETPVAVVAPSSGGVVMLVANAGFYGVGTGLAVTVVDHFGLSDPVGAHLEAPAAGRAGHEKRSPAAWALGRYGRPGSASTLPQRRATPERVAAARRVLGCGAVAELVEATSGPLTWDRFWANLAGSPGRTSLRIPADPVAAEQRFC
jgi:arabinofuranosyltransferase